MLFNNNAFKYKITYKGSFEITQCCTNYKVTLLHGATKIWYNICCIKPYKSNTNVEEIAYEKYVWQCQHMTTSYINLYCVKAQTQGI